MLCTPTHTRARPRSRARKYAHARTPAQARMHTNSRTDTHNQDMTHPQMPKPLTKHPVATVAVSQTCPRQSIALARRIIQA